MYIPKHFHILKLSEVQTEKLIQLTTARNNTMVCYMNSTKQRAKGREEVVPSGSFLTWRSRVSAIKPRTEPFDNGLQTRSHHVCVFVFGEARVCIRESCWRLSVVGRIIKHEIIRLLPWWKSIYEMRNRGQRVKRNCEMGKSHRSINFSIDT